MREVLDTVLYIVIVVFVVVILFILIIKESRNYRPFRSEEDGTFRDEDNNIIPSSLKNNPTTWDDYEKQLDKITSVEKEDLNIVPLNDETPILFDENEVGDDEGKKE